MKIEIMTLFPEMCEAVLSESIIGRAREKGCVDIHCVNIRDYTQDKHNRVDDAPYGGGMGMLMQTQPIYDCYSALCEQSQAEKPHLIYMSPQGQVLTQDKVKALAEKPHIVLLCGHYEGIDQRILDEIVDEEISVGDYVLTGGELPALVLADSVARMLEGVLPNDEAKALESHYSGLLEYPQYTRPYEWHGRKVPDILLSGHHANIEKWRQEKALEVTLQKRPDLLKAAQPDQAVQNCTEENAAANSIFHRTSVRQYAHRQVEMKKIERMLRAAMAAPSAGNQQPWEYYVVTAKEKLLALAKASPFAGCTENAAVAFVACYRKDCSIPEYAQIDMSASVENLLLEADALGLGAVWLGIAPVAERMEAVRDVLSIPESLEAFAVIACGYPADVRPQQDRFDENRVHYIK